VDLELDRTFSIDLVYALITASLMLEGGFPAASRVTAKEASS
jgi:hypothetical protein